MKNMVLIVSLVIAGCASAQKPSPPADHPPRPTYRLEMRAPTTMSRPSTQPALSEGAALTASDVAEALGAKFWKFNLNVPADADYVHVVMQLEEKGKEARLFGGEDTSLIRKDGKHEILIALIPVDGTIADADKVRLLLSTPGSSAWTIEVNPFKQLTLVRTVAAAPDVSPDGTIHLIEGFKSLEASAKSSAEEVLSLKVDFKQ